MGGREVFLSTIGSIVVSSPCSGNTSHYTMGIPKHESVNTELVSKVFVLYTGGTIGMTRNREDVLVPTR